MRGSPTPHLVPTEGLPPWLSAALATQGYRGLPAGMMARMPGNSPLFSPSHVVWQTTVLRTFLAGLADAGSPSPDAVNSTDPFRTPGGASSQRLGRAILSSQFRPGALPFVLSSSNWLRFECFEHSLGEVFTMALAQRVFDVLHEACFKPWLGDSRGTTRIRRNRPHNRWRPRGLEPLEQRALMTVTLLSEGFEGSFPSDNGWSVGDSNSNGTTAYWDDVSSSFGGEGTHGGSWKGYCAGVGYGGTSSTPTYRDSMNAYMSRSINLANLSSANLSFWYKIPSIESGNYDHLRVSIDSANVFDKSVAATSWTQATVSLAPYLGGNRTLKFEFYSDSTGTAEGAYLDDIVVTGEQNNGPPNNNFANRTLIAGTSPTATGTNVNATKEPGEPSHAGNPGGKSVWWTWTAPSSGRVQIDTIGSNFDTLLGVYTGNSVSSLSHKASSDDGGGSGTSLVTFDAVVGTAYQIAVDGYNGASGNITLHVIPQVVPTAQ